jgi:glycosyltransferase involved in cell wall biosynthesis
MSTIAIDGRMWGAGFTGIGNYVREISLRLFAMKPKDRFVLFLSSRQAEEFRPPKNVEVVIADEPIYSFAEQFSFSRKISSVKADITWFPHFNVPLFFRRPFVCTIHDLTILKYPGKKMKSPQHRLAYGLVLRHALKKSRAVITVSRYTKNEILAFQKTDPNKISVVWNGVDFHKYERPNPLKIDIFHREFKRPIFLISGVWREHKNIPNAIRAFDMYRQYGGKGSLVITGRPDPIYPEVQELAKKSVFSADIHLAGFLPEEDMNALFVAADVLLFPSLCEGFGLPAIEAMSAGTPVVCSNRTSLPEVCGDAALYFDPLDPEDIALKMVDGIEDSHQKNLSQKGKKRARLFDWDTAAEKTANAIFGFSS